MKGTEIDGCFYDPELVYLVINYLIEILNNRKIKSLLLDGKNRKFIKYIVRYICSYEYCLDYEKSKKYFFQITTSCYELLFIIIKDNNNIKLYIETYFNLIELINKKCNMYIEIVSLINEKNVSYESFALVKIIINFLNEYIGNHASLKEKLKLYGKNLLSFVLIIRQRTEDIIISKNEYFDNKKEEIKELNEFNELVDNLINKFDI